MRLLSLVFAVFAVFAVATGAAQTTTPIGWRFTLERDAARSYASADDDAVTSSSRPVPITLWYPAREGGTVTTLEELARLSAYQRHAHPSAAAFDEAIAQAVKDSSAPALTARVRASQNAQPSRDKHPLILFAHSTPLGQVTMAEDLAAQGFVVAGLMSRGAARGDYRLSIDDVRGMSEDLEFALRRLALLPYVDATRVAVIGMSNGAFGAVGLANRSAVRAIVSLDGTVGEQAAVRVLPALANAASPVSTPPLLHLYTTGNSFMNFSELQKWPGQCVTVKIPDVRHADFLSYALLKSPVPGDSTRVNVAQKFGAIQRLTGEFLSQLVKRDRSLAQLALTEPEIGWGLAMGQCSAGPRS
jgi:hypothetical protein